MSSREDFLAYIPSQETMRVFFSTEKGQWVLWAGVIFLLLLIVLWILRRRTRSLNNLGLSRIRREWLHTIAKRSEPVKEMPDDGIRAKEEPLEPLALPTAAPVPTPEPSPAVTPSAPAYEPQRAPEPALSPAEPIAHDIPPLIGRLPFCQRPGHTTASAVLAGMRVEAVFVDEQLQSSLAGDAGLSHLPFVPAATVSESFDNIYRRGALIAQPTALCEIETGLAVITKSVITAPLSSQMDWARVLRTDELFLTLLNAMVVAHELNTPCAPILESHGARFFLRPAEELIIEFIAQQEAAQRFAMGISKRQTLNTVIYATLLAAAHA